jgi:hypothetical protein
MKLMNYLVFLDAGAGELEKILSGTKSMVLKEFNPTSASFQEVGPGDNLYFLRNRGDCDLRVKATVSRVLSHNDSTADDLLVILKELQPRLQLTEEQFNYWSAKKQAQLIEFEGAHKINPIHVSHCNITDTSDWLAFENFDLITGKSLNEWMKERIRKE